MEIAIIIPLFLFLAFIFYFFSPSKNFIRKPSATAKVTPNPQEIMSNYEHKKGELKSLFATFDKNGDGFITKQELKESLENIRIFMTEKEIEELVVKVDCNGDLLIDFDEFCSLYESMAGGKDSGERKDHKEEEEEEEDLKEAFEVFDRDKDGLISVEELGLVLSSLGLKEGKRVEACKEMIKKVDVDGDGMVNFDEFKKMMKSRTTPNPISFF